MVTKGLTGPVPLEPTPEGGGGKYLDVRGELFRQQEQQVQSRGEAVWGGGGACGTLSFPAWGLGRGEEARQAAPRRHLGDTWPLFLLTNVITLNAGSFFAGIPHGFSHLASSSGEDCLIGRIQTLCLLCHGAVSCFSI